MYCFPVDDMLREENDTVKHPTYTLLLVQLCEKWVKEQHGKAKGTEFWVLRVMSDVNVQEGREGKAEAI